MGNYNAFLKLFPCVNYIHNHFIAEQTGYMLICHPRCATRKKSLEKKR